MKTVEEKLRAGFHDAAAAAARRKAPRDAREGLEEASHGSKGDDGSESADRLAATPGPVAVNSDASECVELWSGSGPPRGELQGAYLASRRVAMDQSRDAESAASSSLVPTGAFVARSAVLFGGLRRRRSTRAFQGSQPLVALGRELLQRYFGVVKLGLAGAPGLGERRDHPARGLMAALADGCDLSGINRLVPEIRLGDRAAEVETLRANASAPRSGRWSSRSRTPSIVPARTWRRG